MHPTRTEGYVTVMTLPDQAGNAENWALDKLVTILLRQFKRLLMDKGIELTDGQMQAMGEQVAARQPVEAAGVICTALAELIAESETVLAQWGLSFAVALKTQMTDIAGWETTADFLEIANEKVNAEVRISAGAALMTVLGDARHAPYLMQAITHDLETAGYLDVDAVIAKKAMMHAAGLDAPKEDWLARLEDWLQHRHAE